MALAPPPTKRRTFGLWAVAVLAGAALAAAVPQAAATETTGAWIFPTLHRTDALADDLDDTFYIGESENLWLQDSYFGDAASDAAEVSVDLYNPTSATLENVQLFAAVNDISLLTDIAFSGGDGGDVAFAAGDISGGTPFVAGGGTLDPHDIYPAYFVSYTLGDLDAGPSNLRSLTVTVSGDFASGLVVHLDYSAQDASGNAVTGPFAADMNIFDAGEFEEPPACEPAELKLEGDISSSYKPGTGVDIDATLDLVAPFEYEKGQVTVTLSGDSVFTGASVGQGSLYSLSIAFDGSPRLELSGNLTSGTSSSGSDSKLDFDGTLELSAPFEYEKGEVTVTLNGGSLSSDVSAGNASGSSWSVAFGAASGLNLTLNLSGKAHPLLLDGDLVAMSASADWDDCAGGGSLELAASAALDIDPSGDVHSASWWQEQFEKTLKGKKKAEFNQTQADLLLGRVAAHSDVFTYGDWNGTSPLGGDDDGWLDIGSLDDAIDILEGKSPDSKKVRPAERQLLALWLNVACGAVNLDTALEWASHDDGDDDEDDEDDDGDDDDHKASKSLPADLDSAGEILAFLEGQVDDWKGGSGASKKDLRLATKLAKAVSNGTIEAA